MTNEELDQLALEVAECQRERYTLCKNIEEMDAAWRRELSSVTKQRDELVEALKSITEITCIDHRDGTSTVIACDIPRTAREALAKVGADKEE